MLLDQMEFRPATSKWLYASKKQLILNDSSTMPHPLRAQNQPPQLKREEGTRVDETTPVEDEHSDRASRTSRRRRNGESEETIERSASVSLLQQHVSYKSAPERPPLLDVTNIDLDRYVPGTLNRVYKARLTPIRSGLIQSNRLGRHSCKLQAMGRMSGRKCSLRSISTCVSLFHHLPGFTFLARNSNS